MPIPRPPKLQVKAAALNPVDHKMAQHGFMLQATPVVLGCDVAGVVQAVGSKVQGVKAGDRIMAFTPLGTPGYGAFAEQCLAAGDMVLAMPDGLSFEDAAALPVALGTALLGLCQELKVAASPADKVCWRRARAVPFFWI